MDREAYLDRVFEWRMMPEGFDDIAGTEGELLDSIERCGTLTSWGGETVETLIDLFEWNPVSHDGAYEVVGRSGLSDGPHQKPRVRIVAPSRPVAPEDPWSKPQTALKPVGIPLPDLSRQEYDSAHEAERLLLFFRDRGPEVKEYIAEEAVRLSKLYPRDAHMWRRVHSDMKVLWPFPD